MSQILDLSIEGLYTNVNELSAAPEGALATADDIVINQKSIAESRRGFNRLTYSLPLTSDRADKLTQYQGYLIAHYSTSKLAYYNPASGFSVYSGSYLHPDSSIGRIKTAEANSNLYMTSSTGILKLDAIANTPSQAGMVKSLDCKASASVNASGFMSNNSQVAYRIVWGIKDANLNLILGAPSQRAVIANSSGGYQDVSLQITIPSGVGTAHFFQIYRSNQSASSTTLPDDSMQLVYEANPTSGQISAKSITVIDSVPDSLRGAALYTNDTQEGILQSNEMPPFAYDLALFKNCLFYGNIKTKQQLVLSLVSVGGSAGLQLNDTITIAGTTYTAKAAETVGSAEFKLTSSGSAAQNIEDTALSLVRVINQYSSNTAVYAYYISTPSGLPGQLLIEERTLGGSAFSATSTAFSTAWLPALPSSGATVTSSNNTALNGLMYSKSQVPEAVPTANILYVGSAAKKILRIIPLRDSLFILKEDGIYRCTGTGPGNFAVDLLDSTALLVAPESAVALNNKIHALTSQGVVAISDSGVEVISRPIENRIISLFGSSLDAVKTYSFGVGYESDRKYILWTVSSSGDTYPTQAFVWNIFTRTWCRWTRKQAHAIVLSSDDKIYACDPLSSNVVQERKGQTYTDYADEAIAISVLSASGTSIVVNDSSIVSVGDRLYQSANVSSVVSAINAATNTLTVNDTLSWTPGASSSVLKSISCVIEWLPQSGKNPGTLKKFSECVLLLKQHFFNQAYLDFYSDISGSYEGNAFGGDPGTGWGLFPWGGSLWGLVARTAPMRTYIPSEKQRCDLLSVRLRVNEAWARFQVEGLSIVVKGISSRVAS